MAKKAPSKHSRAARRATSPGIDLDKSLKNVRAPPTSVDFRPAILGIHQAAGVAKKTKKQGRKAVLSSRARRRQERGLDRAEAVLERTAQKVQRSKSQARTIQARSKEWTEINSQIVKETAGLGAKTATQGMFGALAGGGSGGDEDDEDDGFEDVDSGDEAVRKFYGDGDGDDLDEAMGGAEAAAGAGSLPAAVPLAALADEEIL